MPGIVKIGYSTKDPKLRAEELNHTGSPQPYIVEYEMLIEEPFQIEQKIHKLLDSKHEGKEWFRCSVEYAVSAIKKFTASSIIYENFCNKSALSLNKDHRPDYYKCASCGAINKVCKPVDISQKVHCTTCKQPLWLTDNFKL